MNWKRSKYGCGEVGADWRKSTYSGLGGCVEVARADAVHVRDTKDAGGPVLTFDRADWRAFLRWAPRSDG